jgi:tubulin polyglutamylase TTLL5
MNMDDDVDSAKITQSEAAYEEAEDACQVSHELENEANRVSVQSEPQQESDPDQRNEPACDEAYFSGRESNLHVDVVVTQDGTASDEIADIQETNGTSENPSLISKTWEQSEDETEYQLDVVENTNVVQEASANPSSPDREHSDTTKYPPDELHTELDGQSIIQNTTTPSKHRARKFAFQSFSHIFSQFATGSRSKADSKDLVKCMQAQLERCSEIYEALDDEESLLFYRIKSHRPEVVDIVSKSLSHRQMSQWEEAQEGALWNLMWTWGMPTATDFDQLLVFQKISRFRKTRGLTRKDLLKKNIQRCVGVSENSVKDGFNIMPLTYALPHEFNSFVKGFASVQQASGNNRSNFWIIKPIGSSRGRGISLVDSVSDVSYSQPIVVQKYISDPLCFMGYKFDLRIYVLVSSFSPLEAFIYKEGLARFGSRQYTASSQSINDLRIHLTNSSIQKEFGVEVDKNHPAYLAGTNGAESKVALTWLWKRLDELGIDSKLLWQSVVDVCIKALIAGGSDIPFQPNSFELFGFDVMFDQDLKCWLIEVNSSPSMSCDSPLDTRIKGALIRDTVALIDPAPIDQRALVDVCTRRLSHRKEASSISSTSILEQDIGRILHERIPRAYGDMPSRLGSYERIAPGTNTYNSLMHK